MSVLRHIVDVAGTVYVVLVILFLAFILVGVIDHWTRGWLLGRRIW